MKHKKQLQTQSKAAKAPNLYPKGTQVLVQWQDNEDYPAAVIDRRLTENGHQSEYYVHYIGFDRRHDEWIRPEMIKHIIPRRKPSSINTMMNLARAAQPAVSPNPSLRLLQSPAVHSPNSAATGSPRRYSTWEEDKIKSIETIELGDHEINTWYPSPYPDDYNDAKQLYICERCLLYMRFSSSLDLHQCDLNAPPGLEVYRHGENRIYEVDSSSQKLYCQNLCLLGKLFIDHKTIYYDIEPFWFYVLTESHPTKTNYQRIVGYFSKEKASTQNYNLACIVVFPPYQRKGYGRLLIEFSYHLSRIEGKPGTPERPLSDLGLATYRNYWARVLMHRLVKQPSEEPIAIGQLSLEMGILQQDIVDTLRWLNCGEFQNATNSIVMDQANLKQLAELHPYRKTVTASGISWVPPSKRHLPRTKKLEPAKPTSPPKKVQTVAAAQKPVHNSRYPLRRR